VAGEKSLQDMLGGVRLRNVFCFVDSSDKLASLDLCFPLLKALPARANLGPQRCRRLAKSGRLAGPHRQRMRLKQRGCVEGVSVYHHSGATSGRLAEYMNAPRLWQRTEAL
jgi:hypothetical protein